jgi:hypothetical protein
MSLSPLFPPSPSLTLSLYVCMCVCVCVCARVCVWAPSLASVRPYLSSRVKSIILGNFCVIASFLTAGMFDGDTEIHHMYTMHVRTGASTQNIRLRGGIFRRVAQRDVSASKQQTIWFITLSLSPAQSPSLFPLWLCLTRGMVVCVGGEKAPVLRSN